MYKLLDIDNIDYVLIISFSKLLCKREDFIQYCFICHTLTPYILILRGTCEATVCAISIIVRLPNVLKIFFVAVRTSIYNNTACILRIVSLVL